MGDLKLERGSMQSSSGMGVERVRDLGELRKAGLFWRLCQAWKARKDLPMLAAQKVLGRIDGVVQVRTRMMGKVYKAPWTALAPWQAEKLRALIDMGVDVTELTRYFGGYVIDYGILSRKTICTAGCAFIVDAFQNTTEVDLFHFHGLGNNNLAENNSHTALATEIPANQYSGGVRPTGNQNDGANNVTYETVASHNQTTNPNNIAEHGIFTVNTQGSGTMLDRHIFTPVPLAVNDTFVTTYRITFSPET